MRRFAFLLPAALGSLAGPGACWAHTVQPPVMPWDPTLCVVTDYLTGPALRTVAWLAFGAAAIGYALGGEVDGSVGRLLRMGAGIMLALHAVQIANFLFG